MTKRNIYFREDGRYEMRYFYGYKKDGKPNYVSIYGNTKKEVKENYKIKMKKLKVQKDLLIYDKEYIGYGILSWINNSNVRNKLSTNSLYEYTIYRRIIPNFAGIKKKKITSEMINKFTEELKNEKLADKTIRDYLILLQQILRHCDITIKVPKPKIDAKEIEVFDENEQARLEKELIKNLNKTSFGIYLALYTGIRIGELCALQLKKIDLANERIYIKYTLTRVKNTNESIKAKTVVIKNKPKTHSSIRYIPIPRFLIPKLKEIKDNSTEDTYLLSGSEKWIETRTYYNRYKRILANLNLPDYNFHATRHTFATRSIKEGTDPKTLSKILGHASVKITLERYVHPSFEDKVKAINKLKPLSKINRQ